MTDIGHESKPIEPIVGVRSPGGEIGVPSPPGGASQKAVGSRPSSLATLEVALPDLRKVLEGLGSHQNVGLTYVIDRETHSVIIKVIDRDTNEVLRQVPSEEMTKLRTVMRDLFGLLFKAKV
ncbi:flagellar protein FlaG [Candidatus Methylomirabilis sp.]|uniref:flagellar protein FlaG n=1 Tax=Candidatus Methylomirabilis sp. TaxID=2032687 RepID=UPI002A5BB67C|nr:flagellar protein FlaG [Candidatus Methylomirabilis sp.]